MWQIEPFTDSNAALFSGLWSSSTDADAARICEQALQDRADPSCTHTICGTDSTMGSWSCRESPLHIAAGRGWGHFVHVLLGHGADIEQPNACGVLLCSTGDRLLTIMLQDERRWLWQFNMDR